MCGIVGYVGSGEASEFLIDGLRRLEYRGYDSAGIAVYENGKIQIEKKKGGLANLEAVLKGTSSPWTYRDRSYTLGYTWTAF